MRFADRNRKIKEECFVLFRAKYPKRGIGEKVMRHSFYYIIAFVIGAVGYCLIEVLWRGYTHISMAFIGGLCFLLINIIGRRFSHHSVFLRAVLCCAVITGVEFVSGFFLNIVYGLEVWDYHTLPFNLLGQICPLYSFLWFVLSFVCLIFIDRKFKKR